MENNMTATADTFNPSVPSDEHVVSMWTPYNLNVDADYKYIPTNKLYIHTLNILRKAALEVLKVVDKVAFDLKVEGRENLKGLENAGFVSVCNHVNFLDCTMIAIALNRTDLKITVLKSNLEIPFIRHIIKASGALPIPEVATGKPNFANAISTLLKQGHVVHFYPEAVLFPGYNGIRGFHKGAFVHAVKNNVPIVPFVVTYHTPKHKYQKMPSAVIHVLPPIYADKTLSEYDQIIKLRDEASKAMNDKFNSTDCLRDNTLPFERYPG